jgi:D-alanyl-D-alanine carboxypeptidase
MALRHFRSPPSRFISVALGAAAALALVSALSAPAQARGWRHRHVHYAVAAAPADPAFAAIVVDATSGRTLYAANEDAPRHPASLTKVMTLYMLFEQLDKGALTLQSQLPISEHAAAQEPTKLGLEPGDTISVDDAIKAIVTRSANDIAVAIAEALGGDESSFADMMTRKAHALGMSHTLYRNASGLPNDDQITTARDLTILARATEERFPRYFKYYSTQEFAYDGEIIDNHNHLLGRVDGVDGIKTGYTRASGFNLLTSVHRDGRSLIAVVLGGRTASARDALMEGLIRDHFAQASDRGHTAPMIAEATTPAGPPLQLASVAVAPAAAPAPPVRAAAGELAEGDADAADETVAPTPPVKPQPAVVAARPAPNVVAAASPEQLGWVKGADAVDAGKPRALAVPLAPAAAPAPAPRDKTAATTVAIETPPTSADHSGWIIQIGISTDDAKANDLLSRARAQNRAQLAAARPFTEKVTKGEDVFYRARFAGLDSASAETACRSLKKSGFPCFAAHD